jgi:hypothetical protein
MRSKFAVCLFAWFCFFGFARGQDAAKFDVFMGYSHVQADVSDDVGLGSFSLNGGEISVAYHAKSWLSAVADIGGYHGKGTASTYLFGPRITYSHFGQITPYSQVLFGVSHATPDVFAAGRQNAFTMTVGGGFDYHLSRRFSIRPIEIGYLLTNFEELNNVRVSSGVVFHF